MKNENRRKNYMAEKKRTILIVEDELINRELLRMMLQEEYELVMAETGAQALTAISEQADLLSLILLDLNLPDLKGVEILRLLRADPVTSSLPVIVMTADQNAEVECLTLGAIDFIPKPYPQQKVVLARILRTIELFEDRDLISFTERDTLTGLYNREYFYRYAERFDKHNKDVETDAVVVDINHFHMFNERFGRAEGDRVLKEIAARLVQAVRASGGIVCRRDGDTFLVYCPHRDDYAEILENAAVEVGESSRVRLRMGIYANTDRTTDMERRFDRAKLAADTVRDSYSSALAVYDNSLHEKELYAEQLLEAFKGALRDRQFRVYFQPKFNVQSEEPHLVSAEALVRWKHPELGMISPGVFIPLIEKNGLIRELDEYVWREAAARVRGWKERLGSNVSVSVNVSRVDLYDPDIAKTLKQIAGEAGLSGGEMMLEITESAYTEDSEQIIKVVSRLREEGFLIEMDDFGTGYSSLNMLSALPIDALKLDMQFIRNAFRKRKDTRLLEAVIGLAGSLELPIIAEGVETAEQMFTLKNMGCDLVQGYYFSKPLPAEEFEEYLKQFSPAPQELPEAVSGENARTAPRDRHTYDAMHDPLTGLYNHSAFEILFQDSDHEHLAVLLVHLTDYDRILAEYGRPGANKAALRTAGVLRASFRSVDNICRLQEDEFVIIMSRMTSAMDEQVFEKIRTICASLAESGENESPVNIRIGVAFSDRENPTGDIFRDAEAALRRAEEKADCTFAVY